MSTQNQPSAWVVVLGYNNADDTVECIRSILESTYPALDILYVDNGSEEDQARQVVASVSGIQAVRHPRNVGVARGFNSGLAHALARGADFVIMVNNDTKFHPGAVTEMVRCARERPGVGLVIPKVFYYDHPRSVWAAGSRFRRFPPAIIQNRTRDDDDGRYDDLPDLEFSPFCVCLFSREVLEGVGLLDVNYHFFYEDYDFCLRARDAGFHIAFAPDAHVWHKISRTIKGGEGKKTEFWSVYGRSHSIFCRKFPRHRAMTGLVSRWYLNARTLYEGGREALAAFREGCRRGRRESLASVPAWNGVDEPDMAEFRLDG